MSCTPWLALGAIPSCRQARNGSLNGWLAAACMANCSIQTLCRGISTHTHTLHKHCLCRLSLDSNHDQRDLLIQQQISPASWTGTRRSSPRSPRRSNKDKTQPSAIAVKSSESEQHWLSSQLATCVLLLRLTTVLRDQNRTSRNDEDNRIGADLGHRTGQELKAARRHLPHISILSQEASASRTVPRKV